MPHSNVSHAGGEKRIQHLSLRVNSYRVWFERLQGGVVAGVGGEKGAAVKVAAALQRNVDRLCWRFSFGYQAIVSID